MKMEYSFLKVLILFYILIHIFNSEVFFFSYLFGWLSSLSSFSSTSLLDFIDHGTLHMIMVVSSILPVYIDSFLQ